MDYSVLNSLNSAKKLTAADKANLFTERMSSTAHQREVEDLKKAGLNPVLSANSSGASTGSAAQDSDETTYDNPIYKLVSNVNKVTNSTAKTYAEAANNLTKTLGKMTAVAEKKVNNADGGITYTSADMKEIADKLLKGASSADATSSKGLAKWISNAAGTVAKWLLPELEEGKKNTNESMYGTKLEGNALRFVTPSGVQSKLKDSANAIGVDLGKAVDNYIDRKTTVVQGLMSLPSAIITAAKRAIKKKKENNNKTK